MNVEINIWTFTQYLQNALSLKVYFYMNEPGLLAQWVTRLTVDRGVTSLILVRSHTFMEIDHEIISMVILLLPLIYEGLLPVTRDVLVNCSVKLTQERSCGKVN